MSFGVAMISSVFYPSIGGAQRVVLDTGRALRERGVDVFVVTRHYRGLARYEEVNGIPTYRVGRGDAGKVVAALSYILGAIWLLLRLRRRYQVMHCHQMISPMTIGLLAKALTRRPLVIMPHRSGEIGDIGVLTLRRPLTGRLRLAAARRWGDAFLCISQAIHQEVRDIGVAETRLWDVVNGVDTDLFRPATQAERAAAQAALDLPDAPHVLFTGRLVQEKGINVLLDAWPTVLAAVPEARLLLVGDGDRRAELEQQAQALDIAGRVRFLGGRDDIATCVRAANVFVLPSFAEGLPVALLEAMAGGLVCVGTNVDGTKQLLSDRENGRTVEAGAAGPLAAALVEALTHPEAALWSKRARQLVCEQYSLASVVDAYIAMYTVLQTPGSPDRHQQETVSNQLQGVESRLP